MDKCVTLYRFCRLFNYIHSPQVSVPCYNYEMQSVGIMIRKGTFGGAFMILAGICRHPENAGERIILSFLSAAG